MLRREQEDRREAELEHATAQNERIADVGRYFLPFLVKLEAVIAIIESPILISGAAVRVQFLVAIHEAEVDHGIVVRGFGTQVPCGLIGRFFLGQNSGWTDSAGDDRLGSHAARISLMHFTLLLTLASTQHGFLVKQKS